MKAIFWTSGSLILWIFAAFSFTAIAGEAEDPAALRVNTLRLNERIDRLAGFGGTGDGGVHRVAFSSEDIASRGYLMDLMKEAGLEVRIDEAGNIIGRREGKESDLPVIMAGSHSDTVPHGGRFDGSAGVLSAIEAAQVLHENGLTTRHPLEIVIFTDEEGGLVGSRAMTGTITPEALGESTHSGKIVREGVRLLGGNPEAIGRAARPEGSLRAFIELHIEQGAILDSRGIDIGVVEGIVGINWWDVYIEGFANHAGTTPMDARNDALLSAAHLIIAVNRIATETPGSQVGTVGRIEAAPGAPNVISDKVTMSLEIRDLSAAKIQELFVRIQAEADSIAERFGTPITFDPIDATAVPAPTDPDIRRLISEAAEDLGLSSQLMPSGAGHDAQDMARIVPTGMIFVPSIGGISHSPKERSTPAQLVNGANVLLQTLLKIDRSGENQ
jgi:N-carbamoyl-L-amino-acid hydrolase